MQPAYGNKMLKWPYPINYRKENVVKVDVLVVGGGLSGGNAAIEAAKRGLKTAVIDKGPIEHSGNAGAGIDHWREALTNPCSKITPEEYIEEMDPASKEFSFVHYISAKRSYETLLEIEKMGLNVRDETDTFKGAPFRDEDTKLLFAYDYENKFDIKLRGGSKLKSVIYNELKRTGAEMYERIMITCLLTEDGKRGKRVIGATGVSMQTGEFYIFKSKATILTTGNASGIWTFSTEYNGGNDEHDDPNNTGDAYAMAWKAGTKFTLMGNLGKLHGGGFAWPDFGTGCPDNTWFPCTIVDAEGKEIPWEDEDGKILNSVEERNYPSTSQEYITTSLNNNKKSHKPHLISDLPERIKSGEFKLPLYADLTDLPEDERRSIWGVMIGNEGKTRYPVYNHYTEAGFNPDKDMLQCPMMDPDSYGGDGYYAWFHGDKNATNVWRQVGGRVIGGPVLDWNLMTNIPGLFAAGKFGMGDGAASACTTGRYVGAIVAERYIDGIEHLEINKEQLKKEKERVYAPLNREDSLIGWKELAAGICRVMQSYCSENKTDITLKLGLEFMKSIRENEYLRTYARNPHELVRVLECESKITVAEMILHGILSRNEFEQEKKKDYRDYFIVNQLVNGKVETTELEDEFWLKGSNASTYIENFQKYSCI